ncbi:MAG: hypothetical protein ACI9N3_000100 [Colwellia sp.]|jgi:hypothetical protein
MLVLLKANKLIKIKPLKKYLYRYAFKPPLSHKSAFNQKAFAIINLNNDFLAQQINLYSSLIKNSLFANKAPITASQTHSTSIMII